MTEIKKHSEQTIWHF